MDSQSLIHDSTHKSLGCWQIALVFQLFHDGGRYHIESSRLICSANQWTGFYMISASVMKELKRDIEWKLMVDLLQKVTPKFWLSTIDLFALLKINKLVSMRVGNLKSKLPKQMRLWLNVIFNLSLLEKNGYRRSEISST